MARIADLLAQGRTFSFEFFPPKTPEAADLLFSTLTELEPLRPSFVSVTYGAGGGTRALTHEIVTHILRATSMVPMAHLTCAAHTREQLAAILTDYRDAGVENILALRGDPPKEMLAELPPSELEYAGDLVDLVREIGPFSVGVAIHPEGHPASTARVGDLSRQAEKLERADFGISQFFFEAPVWFDFVGEMRDRGVTAPLVPGIMPVTNVKSVKRMAELSGAAFPGWLEQKLRSVEDDRDAQYRVGVDAAVALCSDLLAGGVDGLHFYTLNRSTATRDIYAELGLAPDAIA
jgi:methylenetetrahydrofolate reductase (NADPH)